MLSRFYKTGKNGQELCYLVETERPLSSQQKQTIKAVLADGFDINTVREMSNNPFGRPVVTIGPRPNFATPFSNHLIGILENCGVPGILRVEVSRVYQLSDDVDQGAFVTAHSDRMTECLYPTGISTLSPQVVPGVEVVIDMINKGPDALLEIPGLAMGPEERQFYYDYFVGQERRNTTLAEILDLNNANSDHSRHVIFRGGWVLDKMIMSLTLMDLVQAPYLARRGNSVIAFADNSSAIDGFTVEMLVPEFPGRVSRFVVVGGKLCIIFTAETHNFPTGIAPYPGAATGTGGRIRDILATGRGGLMTAGTSGYCVGSLCIPGYVLPWEVHGRAHPPTLATPLQILIFGSNGCANYGNEIGEPVILGFCRAFDLLLRNGDRFAPLKPVLFTGGIGVMREEHLQKEEPENGVLIVQIGGPDYLVCMGGGAASSMNQGENKADLDFNAVQRGDAEMQQRAVRVVRACIEMGDNNPIISIHDQGAGGPANVLKELVEKTGGRINLRKIRVGDPTMQVHEIWVAEFQERLGMLIRQENIELFQQICQRERVNCEVLGEVTGDGRFVVVDDRDGSTPVNLDLRTVLSGLPQKTFKDGIVDFGLVPVKLPDNLKVSRALSLTLRLLSVGSKGFLAHKKDRSVTGLIVGQQCWGRSQVTVGDCAVIRQSYFGDTGAATAIGEQPIMMLIDPAAATRRAITEAITNLVAARITGLEDVRFSANWMWAPKLPGEGAAMYMAAEAARDFLFATETAIDGGKDSCSMATKHDGETIKSIRQLVMSAYCGVADVNRYSSPDIKQPGSSQLIHIDLGEGMYRLGGSALAQVFEQIGNDCPDVDPQELVQFVKAIMHLHDEQLMLAYHDISDDGLIVAILEMAIAGLCGLEINLEGTAPVMNKLFAGEAGALLEVANEKVDQVLAILLSFGLVAHNIGHTTVKRKIIVFYNGQEVLRRKLRHLWKKWEMTSRHLDLQQTNPECVKEEYGGLGRVETAVQKVKFPLNEHKLFRGKYSPRAAILREEGSNGDREMTAAFHRAGFEVFDVTMTDLLGGVITLDDFQMLVSVGGFSYADDPASAKGWAATIRFNSELQAMFTRFFARPDTLSFHVCNGFQLATLCGWLPWPGMSDEEQPLLTYNKSGRFESRRVMVKINESSAVMLDGMTDSVLGVWVAHGEGRLKVTEAQLESIKNGKLAPIVYVGAGGKPTMRYPANPNGSPDAIAALSTENGRHLGMMPHPERDMDWPWQRMFQNAYDWCLARR